MTRRSIILAAATVAILTAATVGFLVWRNHVSASARPNITLNQAGPIAEHYATDTLKQLPGNPHLRERGRTNVPCDDPADHAPPGTAELAISYDLTFDTPPDNTQVFNHLHDYWTGKGYHTVLDQRNNIPTRVLGVENPADGFRMGLTEGSGGELTVNVSTPCLHP